MMENAHGRRLLTRAVQNSVSGTATVRERPAYRI